MNELTNKQAHEFCLNTLKLKKTLESGFLSLGEKLKKIRDERLWESNWESFELYLEDARITPATASRLITVYETFVLDYGMKEESLGSIGWSVLYEISLKSETKSEAKEFVEKAMVMKRDDLMHELKSKKRNQDCKHPKKYQIEVCPDCPFKRRIYNN